MKIIKYVHSCLLVETNESAVLFDPGQFSYESGLIDVAVLPKLDYLVITHEHHDHFYLPLVVSLCRQFPDLKIVTTKSVAEKLKGQVSAEVLTTTIADCELFESPHEALPMGQAPENIGVHYADVFSHPGDSHSFSNTKAVLAMPMTAPWGSMTVAIKKIKELKPKTVIPIHDWHWRPEALPGMYERIQAELKQHGIDFIIPVDGQAIELW